MDGVHRELEEAKGELKKLREECLIQRELSGSLKKAHVDQLFQLQEAKLQIQKQAKELNAKAEEAAEAARLNEEIKLKLQEVESKLKQASSANETLRRESNEKVENLEEENRKLVSALDEATARMVYLEGKVSASDKEMAVLKGLLSDARRKLLEAEQKAEVVKEMRQRDDIIGRLEEQSMNIQDQLKWKKEQFEHLEEAHKRLQSQFKSSKDAWENEKSSLLEEVSFLQTSLDTLIRKSESLETQLKFCNQALAHEESSRKTLELQLSESKACFENVVVECHEAKSMVEILTTKRDEEVASLRSSMGMKDAELNETEYRISHLQQENQELLQSVKELQAAQFTKRKADPLLTKLKNKIKDLEEAHSSCSLTLKEKEDEWKSEMDAVKEITNSLKSDLKKQNEQIHQLQTQLECCQSSLEASGEEVLILLMVLKSEFAEAWLQFLTSESRNKSCSKHREQKIMCPVVRSQLETCSPLKAENHLQQADAEMASFAHELESFILLEERTAAMENEMEKSRQKLEESSLHQTQLREQIRSMEEALKEASNALDRSNSELSSTIYKSSQAEAELLTLKSTAECLRDRLEQCQEICCQMETSLLRRVENEECLRKENENMLQKLDAQSKELKCLQLEFSSLELESHRQDTATRLARLKAEEMLQQEKEKHQMVAEAKNRKIQELQALALSWEQHLVDAEISYFAETVGKIVEIDALREALGKAEHHMNLESCKKNQAICDLENEVGCLKTKLSHQAGSLFHLEHTARDRDALLRNKQLEIENMKEAYENEQANLKKMVEELELKKGALLNNIDVLSLERQNLLEYVAEICKELGEFCEEDLKLIGTLMTRYPNNDGELKLDAVKGEKFRDHAQGVDKVACLTNEVRRRIDGRLPLHELND